MDALFTTFCAIEKRRHQRHKRRAIIFSSFSRNTHNIMAMAIQYTSNGLSTDLVVHQLIFFYSFPVALVSIPLPKSLSPVCFVQSTILILWKPVLRMLNCYHIPRDLPQSSRAVPGSPVIATVLARHGFDRVYMYTSNFNRTILCRSVSCWHGKIVSCKRGITMMVCVVCGVSVMISN